MKTRSMKSKLSAVLLALCMALSLVPVTALAVGSTAGNASAKSGSTITDIAVGNVKLNYQPGDTPQATAQITGSNPNYTIEYENWQKKEKDADDVLTTVAYWYSDEGYYSDGDSRFNAFEKGGRYTYCLCLKAKDGYTFDSNLKTDGNVTLNGASLPWGSWVDVMNDGTICLITYGAETRPGQVVEKIDLSALTSFNAGDEPRFSSGVVNPFVDTDHQRWDVNDGSGYGITSSDYWNERYDGKLITEFEAGKSYTYGVYFKISDLGMQEGYRFDQNTKLFINDEEITLTPGQVSVDPNGETIWFFNVLTMTPTTTTVIDEVEINDVTVSFKDGDKPVFTGKVPDGAEYAYRAEWWELDSTTGLISTEPEWGSGIYENKITAFEAGKTYYYGVYVTAYGDVGNVRYVFGPDTKLKINGKYVNYHRYEGDTSDGSDGTMWVLTDLAMTPEANAPEPPIETYTVTYTDGVEGEEVFADQVTSGLKAGDETPAFVGEPTREGYKFAGWIPEVAATVVGNATYVAQWEKLQPAETYTVTYEDGRGGMYFTTEVHSGLKKGDATPTYNNGVDPTNKLNAFIGWSPEVEETVTGDVTYVARWESKTSLLIKKLLSDNIQVECVNDGSGHGIKKYDTSVGGYSATTLEGRDGKITSTITISAKRYIEQYNEDMGKTHQIAAEEPEKQTIVVEFDSYDAGVEDVRIKEGAIPVTFKVTCGEVVPVETYTVTYTDGVEGEEVFADQVTSGLKAGDETPAFVGALVREGYAFAGWKPEVAETVTGNVVYEATWMEKPVAPSEDQPNEGETTDQGADAVASPKTGDTSNVLLWAALLLVSGGAAAGAVIMSRRKTHNR